MKKLISILLTVCICFSLGTVLTACNGVGGVDNPYANFLSSFHQNNGTEYFEDSTGVGSKEQVSDYTSVNCSVYFYGTKGPRNSLHVQINNATETFTNEPGPTDDVNFFMRGVIRYTANSNTLTVIINNFGYNTYSAEKIVNNKTQYEWKDGFAFNPASDGTGVKEILILEYDISKYFENGSLEVADATVTKDFDMQYLTDDCKGMIDTEHTYTERNPEWKATAMTHINSRVNAILEGLDALIEEKSK